MWDQSRLNPGSIRAQSMQQFNPRPKRAEKGINPNKSWCHFLECYGTLIMDWAWIELGLNRFWKHFCVLKIIPYMVKIIKISIWMVPKSVRFNQILPFHRLFLLQRTNNRSLFSFVQSVGRVCYILHVLIPCLGRPLNETNERSSMDSMSCKGNAKLWLVTDKRKPITGVH